MIKLRPEERKPIADYIHSVCAITLDDSKSYLIESRLSDLAEEFRCSSLGELMTKAKADASRSMERRVIDAITTNETLFFRDNGPFELLRHKILPELFDRRKRENTRTPLRIWSAACSTGQEIYSTAIVLKELLGNPIQYGCRLVGTDISNEALAKASKGIFSAVEISRGLSDNMRDKYFRQAPGGWQICDELRGMVSFKPLNLMSDFGGMGQFEIVFCRNVAIYFTERDKTSLFARLQKVLGRDGYLLIGAMESLNGTSPQFQPHRYLRSVYYRLQEPPQTVAV